MASSGGYGASQNFSDLANELGRAAGNFAALSSQFGALTFAIQSFRALERQLVLTNSVAGGTVKEFNQMELAVKRFSLVTNTSSVEAASALYYLASAGFSVRDSLKAMNGVLLLAQATMSNVAEVADIVAGAIQAFGLSADDANRVANLFTASISKSQATIQKLGYSFRQVAPVAKIAGLSIEETTAALSLLYNVGLRGEQAGTALRNILIRLVQPTGEAAEIFQELGISTLDAGFNMRKTYDVLKDLASFNLAEGALKTIFGDEAIAGASALLAAVQPLPEQVDDLAEAAIKGGDAFTRMLNGISGTNYAVNIAAQQMETLDGAIRRAQNAVTLFGTEFGKELAPYVSDISRVLTDMALGFDRLDESTKKMLVNGAAFLSLLLALRTASKVLSFSGAFLGAGGALGSARGAAGALGAYGAARGITRNYGAGGGLTPQQLQLLAAQGIAPNARGRLMQNGRFISTANAQRQVTQTALRGAGRAALGAIPFVGTAITAGFIAYELFGDQSSDEEDRWRSLPKRIKDRVRAIELTTNEANQLGERYQQLKAVLDELKATEKTLQQNAELGPGRRNVLQEQLNQFLTGPLANSQFRLGQTTAVQDEKGNIINQVEGFDSVAARLAAQNEDTIREIAKQDPQLAKIVRQARVLAKGYVDLDKELASLPAALQAVGETIAETAGVVESYEGLGEVKLDQAIKSVERTLVIPKKLLNYLDEQIVDIQVQVAKTQADLKGTPGAKAASAIRETYIKNLREYVDTFTQFGDRLASELPAIGITGERATALTKVLSGQVAVIPGVGGGTQTLPGLREIVTDGLLQNMPPEMIRQNLQEALNIRTEYLTRVLTEAQQQGDGNSRGTNKALLQFVNSVKNKYGDIDALLVAMTTAEFDKIEQTRLLEQIDEDAYVRDFLAKVSETRNELLQTIAGQAGELSVGANAALVAEATNLQTDALLAQIDDEVKKRQVLGKPVDQAAVAALKSLIEQHRDETISSALKEVALTQSAALARIDVDIRDSYVRAFEAQAAIAIRGTRLDAIGFGGPAMLSAEYQGELNTLQNRANDIKLQIQQAQKELDAARRINNPTEGDRALITEKEKLINVYTNELMVLDQLRTKYADFYTSRGAQLEFEKRAELDRLAYQERMLRYSGSFGDGFAHAAEEQFARQATQFELGKDIFVRSTDLMADAFGELTVNMGKNWRDTISSMLRSWASFVAQTLARRAFSFLFNAGLSMLGGPAVGANVASGAGNFVNDFSNGMGFSSLQMGFAKGGVFDMGQVVRRYGLGGVVDRPTIFPMAKGAGLMGEAGPEAIMPLVRGPNGSLGVMAHGGGGNNIVIAPHIEVNAQSTGDARQDQENAENIARQTALAMRGMIIETIRQEQRPGGALDTTFY
jgi:TP901 family phage tail tape measure protein/lambda family phage tail tape measure protein